jgi:hypothetical protein
MIGARPAPLSDDATQAEAIDWLKPYVGAIDNDLSRILNEIRQGTAAAIAAAAEQDEQIRKQLEDEKEQRRIELRWSVRRQAIGTFCVVVGLGLTTWGSLLALSVGTTTPTTTVTTTTMTTTTTSVTAATPTATHRADVDHPARHIHSPQARG